MAVPDFSERIFSKPAKGSENETSKERRRFYFIALGSQREVHALLDLEGFTSLELKSDHLGAKSLQTDPGHPSLTSPKNQGP